MKKAKIKIKGLEGELTEFNLIFHSDIESLKKGDVITVYGRYGLELGVFEEYTTCNLEPSGFVIDKVSGARVTSRIDEQKSLLVKEVMAECEEKVKGIYKL